MSQEPSRTFTTDFKQALMLRLEAGETLASVSKDAGVRRKSLYEWRAAWRALGVAGLNRKRGRKPGKPGTTRALSSRGAASEAAIDELAQARVRIAELEGVIGRQQVDLDFFRQALRLADEPEPPAPIAPASTRPSKR